MVWSFCLFRFVLRFAFLVDGLRGALLSYTGTSGISKITVFPMSFLPTPTPPPLPASKRFFQILLHLSSGLPSPGLPGGPPCSPRPTA